MGAALGPTSFTGHLEADQARTQLLEAKAALELRDYVFESALVARPILRAVHGGTQASPVERSVFTTTRTRTLVWGISLTVIFFKRHLAIDRAAGSDICQSGSASFSLR